MALVSNSKVNSRIKNQTFIALTMFNPLVTVAMNKTHISMLEGISLSCALDLNINSSVSDSAFITKKLL